MSDPLAKKIGKKAANAVRQQVKDIGEEVKEIPKSGKQQITGKDEESVEQAQDDNKDTSQSAKQQLLTLLRGSKKNNKQKNQSAKSSSVQGNPNDDAPQQQRYGHVDRDIEKARREREEKEGQRQAVQEQQEQAQEDKEKEPFTTPKGRKPRGMQNPMARKGKKKNELGRTAKG